MQRTLPDLRAILDDLVRIEVARRRCPMHQVVRGLSHALGVSPDTVDSWRQGTRSLPPQRIKPLLLALGYRSDSRTLSSEGAALRDRLLEARKLRSKAKTWKQKTSAGEVVLAVRNARYPGAGRFVRRFFRDFLEDADIEYQRDGQDSARQAPPDQTFERLFSAVYDGSLAVAVGVLSTPRLHLDFAFFPLPITYRTNAVALRADVDRLGGLDRVRRLLARTKPAREARTRLLRTLAMKSEIGHVYARRTLGFEEREIRAVRTLRAEAFCEALLAEDAREGDRVPVAIVDEITCLCLLRRLQGRGQLLLPLVPNHREPGIPIPPAFPLGICCSLNQEVEHARKGELRDYLRDALSEYIATNAHRIACGYLALRNQITGLLDRAVPEIPIDERSRWLGRTFRLRDSWESWTVEPPHWQAVLREAMQLLHEREMWNHMT
jgi:hypothetical protein